jgi:hypothetical protein
MSVRRLAIAVCLFGGVFYVGARALQEVVPSDTAGQVALAQNLLDLDSFQELIRQVVLEQLKPEYVSQHNWGHQAQVTQGVALRGKWYAPRLEKKTKNANDGLWQRFNVTLVEPDQNLHTRVDQVTAAADGRVAIVLLVEARMTGKGQFERWKSGAKLFDISAEAESTIAARVECELGIHREPGTLVDDIVLDPRVTAIHLQVVDLDLHRVGKLGHDVSRELGNALRPTIAHELEQREPKIVAKANTSIDKRRAKLRFSPEQFLASGWSKFETAIAGAPSQGTVQK